MDPFTVIIALGSVLAIFVVLYLAFVNPKTSGTEDKDPDAQS